MATVHHTDPEQTIAELEELLSTSAAMRRARAAGGAAVALACCALLAAGCGSSSLSSTQLRHKAARICSTAQHSSESIAAPTEPRQQTQRFLARGVAALAPAVAALHRLDPPSELGERYAAALHASDRELSRPALGARRSEGRQRSRGGDQDAAEPSWGRPRIAPGTPGARSTSAPARP